MASPYSIGLTLTYPPDDGNAPVVVGGSVQGSYSHKSSHDLQLTGAGTHVVGFGSIGDSGAKAIFVEYPPATAAAAVSLFINDSSDSLEIAPGGFLALSSPNPTVGVTALSITHTTAARLKVWILG